MNPLWTLTPIGAALLVAIIGIFGPTCLDALRDLSAFIRRDKLVGYSYTFYLDEKNGEWVGGISFEGRSITGAEYGARIVTRRGCVRVLRRVARQHRYRTFVGRGTL